MTVLLVREIPLDPDPEYDVRYTPEVVREIVGLDGPGELMDELEDVLCVDPHRPRGGRGRKLSGAGGLYRYRPRYDDGLRVFYAIEGDEVWILGLHPRKSAYRPQNIETALSRFQRARE